MMEKFLQETKNKLICHNVLENNHIVAVLGNEACDLDSAVSSIVYAFFLHTVLAYPKQLIVPVLNIPRNALRLRTEVVHKLSKENIPLETLMCRDEINFKALHENDLLKLVLVDHNVLPGPDKDLETSVVEIVDHHKQEYQPRARLSQVVVEPVGSCCSLVAEKIFQHRPDLLSSQVSMLLYSAILIDTTNLSEVTQRATAKDRDMVLKLEQGLPGVVRKDVYEEIQKAKESVEGFTLEDLLHKDQKVLKIGNTVLAISTIVVTLQDFVNRIQSPTELQDYCAALGVHILVLLNSIILEDAVLREVAAYSPLDIAASKVCKILMESQNPNLSLKPKMIEGVPPGLRTFDQQNIIFTRKAVLPLLKESIQQDIQDFDQLFMK